MSTPQQDITLQNFHPCETPTPFQRVNHRTKWYTFFEGDKEIPINPISYAELKKSISTLLMEQGENGMLSSTIFVHFRDNWSVIEIYTSFALFELLGEEEIRFDNDTQYYFSQEIRDQPPINQGDPGNFFDKRFTC